MACERQAYLTNGATGLMSASSPWPTFASALHMSAFGGKADMTVCGSPLLRSLLGVKRTCCFALQCLLMTQSRHGTCFKPGFYFIASVAAVLSACQQSDTRERLYSFRVRSLDLRPVRVRRPKVCR